jgi:hypothetical protein
MREVEMTHGPIEILVLAFPGNKFTGAILPEVERLIANDTIHIVDGLIAKKDENGVLSFVEWADPDLGEGAAELSALLDQPEGLLSEEDVDELAADLGPNSTAAIIVFEHTWAIPIREAVIASGGQLLADIRVPPAAIEELRAELANEAL